MRKRLVLKPHGWLCSLQECEEGPFLMVPVDEDKEANICFKTEYNNNDHSVRAFNSVGEAFVGRDATMVQPLEAVWEEYDG